MNGQWFPPIVRLPRPVVVADEKLNHLLDPRPYIA